MKNESYLWSPRQSAEWRSHFAPPHNDGLRHYDPEPTPEAQQTRGRIWSKACYFCGARCQCPPGGYGLVGPR